MRLVTDEMEESIRAERTDLFYELFEGREDVAFLDQPHPHQEKLEEGDMIQPSRPPPPRLHPHRHLPARRRQPVQMDLQRLRHQRGRRTCLAIRRGMGILRHPSMG